MILGILSLVAGVLPKVFLGYLQARNTKEIAWIKAEQERRALQAEIILMQYQHPVAWMPRTIIEFSVALYTAQVFLSSMLHLPMYGPLKLPVDFIWVLCTVIGGMFLTEYKRIKS